MKKLTYFLTVVVALTLVSCNSNPLIGEWKMEQPEAEASENPGEQIANKMFSEMELSFIFKDEGVLITKMKFGEKEKEDELNYKVEGDQLIIIRDGEEEKSTKYNIEGDKLILSDMEGSSMEELVLIKQ